MFHQRAVTSITQKGNESCAFILIEDATGHIIPLFILVFGRCDGTVTTIDVERRGRDVEEGREGKGQGNTPVTITNHIKTGNTDLVCVPRFYGYKSLFANDLSNEETAN